MREVRPPSGRRCRRRGGRIPESQAPRGDMPARRSKKLPATSPATAPTVPSASERPKRVIGRFLNLRPMSPRSSPVVPEQSAGAGRRRSSRRGRSPRRWCRRWRRGSALRPTASPTVSPIMPPTPMPASAPIPVTSPRPIRPYMCPGAGWPDRRAGLPLGSAPARRAPMPVPDAAAAAAGHPGRVWPAG